MKKEIIFLFFIIKIFFPILSITEWWEDTKVPLLNDSNFYDFVGKEKYVVVEFFTKWCIYCKLMSPEYEKFYELYLQKREDVIVSKIECSINQNICMDYGIFAFPFIALFFPGDKKMKSVFKYRRIVDDFDKWVNLTAPKKNLKPVNKKEEVDNNNNDNNKMTEIEDYISKQFSDIKLDINNIEKYINKISNNGKNEILLENLNFDNDNDNEYDEDIIEIKVTPFLLVKIVLFIFLIRFLWYYIKTFLFKHSSMPNDIHQKN